MDSHMQAEVDGGHRRKKIYTYLHISISRRDIIFMLVLITVFNRTCSILFNAKMLRQVLSACVFS